MINAFMNRAIALSCESVALGGGPFGAVVVLDGSIVGEGTNQVVASHDPTAHAEVSAVRSACRALGTHSLQGAVIYTTCEPCPMCLGAIWWARIGKVYFGNTRADAAAIGFDDAALYQEVGAALELRRLPLERMMAEDCIAAFHQWLAKPDRVPY